MLDLLPLQEPQVASGELLRPYPAAESLEHLWGDRARSASLHLEGGELANQEREEALAKALKVTAPMAERVFADRDTIGVFEFWPWLLPANLR